MPPPTYEIPPLTEADKQRFWLKVKRSGGCWEWQGAKVPQGYGRFRIRKQVHYAHRVAWTLRFGDIPKGLSIMHKCDNPPCCRPSHMMLGTYSDNKRDSVAKGRAATRNRARLTLEEIEIIKGLHANGTTRIELAKMYGVGISTIRRAIIRK